MNRKKATPTEKPFSNLPAGKRFFVKIFVGLGGLLAVLVYALVCLHFLVPRGSWLNVVDGDSMYPTLEDGQFIYTANKDIGYGDIVTAYFPEGEGPEDAVIVKRVIGLPGDHIRIDVVGVYVNGVPLDETYLTPDAVANTYRETPYNNVTLGADEFYLMGDNRFVSNDSRYFGPVKDTDILYTQSISPGTNFWVRLVAVIFILVSACILHTWVDNRLTRFAQRRFQKKTNEENL